MDKKYFNLIFIIKGDPNQLITARAGYQPFSVSFKVPPQIPGRKSVDGVGSDGVGHAKHAREDSPDVSPGFGFNFLKRENHHG